MRIRTVDAFADRPYTGNPAAVVLLDSGPFPEDSRLQALAAEMNLAETAFAHPLPGDADADWALRWFTPSHEVALCGHATLATAHLLAGDGAVKPGETMRFRSLSGVLTATAAPDGALTLDFPTATLTPTAVPESAAAVLGAQVVAAWETGSLDMLLLELPDEGTVRGLAPDLNAITAFPNPAVVVTARGDGVRGVHDYVSRVFAPAHGIPEDPVTGSAHTALAPLWSGRTGRDDLTGLQVSPRTGYVRTGLRGERTLLTGTAVTMLDAQLLVEP
ncbi:PhzF family phenazine biosynthesis protein [Streptomyces iconiensis]|uniref:PhzF family phenazine biosynthesis protein n=1 Tax=Streptomyces iconiensis TaxID=1384038 RepID=A0ABT7A318_9ACTN|nr:PhzF family phenazine biosynthesis protein [Streptomyces iconiensis]MDJ1135696.1 PhzF family phenazine biosynthesis protein [Streptomyces iconiensis]